MKNTIKKAFFWWIVFLGTIITWFLSFAYTGLPTQPDKSTITQIIWNDVINKINEIWNEQRFYWFSAYQSTAQSLTAATRTKINFQTEDWDTSWAYNTTNSRFQPTKAWYYNINWAISLAITSTNINPRIYKNWIILKRWTNALQWNMWIISATVYLNWTTDYIELWWYLSSSTTTITWSDYTYFQASYLWN